MPKVKAIKWCVVTALVWSGVGMVHAQPVLGQVIDQTKQLKQRQLAPTNAKAVAEEVAPPPPPPPPPTLWSISGINNQLIAELWQGDSVYRLPLEKGAKLPTGWQVVGFDKQSVTFKLGKQTRKLTAAARGSTGWEYPGVPRTAAALSAGGIQGPSTNSPGARAAASNLPPAAMPASPNAPR